MSLGIAKSKIENCTIEMRGASETLTIIKTGYDSTPSSRIEIFTINAAGPNNAAFSSSLTLLEDEGGGIPDNHQWKVRQNRFGSFPMTVKDIAYGSAPSW